MYSLFLKLCFSLFIFISTLGIVDYFVLGEMVLPENGWKEFFRRENRSFKLSKEFIPLAKIPPGNGKELIEDRCKKMQYGPNRTLTREWCYKYRDSNGRNSIRDMQSQKGAIVFGGSYAFGDGLRDEETFSSQLGKKGYAAYNFSYSGAGAHQYLKRIYTNPKLEELDGKEVLLIYPFIKDHFRRQTFGRSMCCYSWGPRFEIDKENQLNWIDDFEAVYMLSDTANFIKTVPNSSWIIHQYYNKQVVYNDEDIKLSCSILEEIFKKSKSDYGDHTKMYVVNMWDDSLPKFSNCLKQSGIEYLEFHSMLNKHQAGFDINDYFFEGDFHPTALATKLLADVIEGIK